MKILHTLPQPACNLFWFFVTILSATACSDSSGPAVQQGRIVNTAIQGVNYATETQSGVTDASGSFKFLQGETISFSLGGTQLASVPAKAELNWFELAGLPEIPVGYRAIKQVQYADDGEPSMSRLGALASLLTTVDDDRDSSNGVNITPAVATLFDGIEVDMQYASSPQYDVQFRRLLRHAARDGALQPRRPRNGAYAIQDVYDNHNVDPGVVASRRSENDNNNDGSADWIRLLTYSSKGRVTRDYIDSDANGAPNILVDLSYNEEGQGLVYAHDNDADGSVDRTRSWQYDEFGDLARAERDDDGDGIPDFTEARVINENGMYARREVINTTAGIHTIEVWTADSDGNRTLYDLDEDGDGIFDVAVFLTYDEPLGPWITRSQDDDRDGIYEEVRERTYDANGFVVRDVIDTGADGSPDWIESTTRDSQGRLLRVTRDTDGDGNLNYDISYTLDGNGNVTRREYDTDGDGSPDFVYTYTFDADGNNIRFDNDRDGDGTIDQVRTYIYDIDGNQIESRFDSNADGVADRYTYNILDENGYQVRYESDNNADGVIDRTNRYLDWQPTSVAAYF